MRFDPDAAYPKAVKTIPHVAFEVDDLAAALLGSAGVKVAMILDHGAPIELMEFAPPQELQRQSVGLQRDTILIDKVQRIPHRVRVVRTPSHSVYWIATVTGELDMPPTVRITGALASAAMPEGTSAFT